MMGNGYLLVVLVLGVVSGTQFTHHIVMDPEGKYNMWWSFDNDTITIKVTCKTTGWIGWGVSPNGVMKGADMVIGWVDNNGKSFFNDRHATGHQMPSIDVRQDYENIELSEKNGETTMTFRRKLSLCGKEDNRITGDTMRVLYAWGDNDPINNQQVTYHSKRGSKSVLLLDYSNPAKRSLPSGHKTREFRMKDFRLPSKKTAYWCKGFKLPVLNKKHHLIAIEAIITPGNENFVHHMLLYQCKNTILNKDLGVQHECYRNNMPDLDCGNDMVVHAWAIGGVTYFYPEDVGFSLGTEDDPKYGLLEVHYDNQAVRSDIIDNSGLRFIYTDKLRKYDATILAAGIEPTGLYSQVIPQGQKNFTSYGFCSSSCLNITTQKHYIFTVLLHSHVAGRKIIARLIRDSDGVETKRISQDLNYDFNFQELRHLEKPIEIPPGHSIDVECVYNTETIPNPVKSGLGTSEEMCVAYAFVYPKLPIKTCYSTSRQLDFWGAKEFKFDLDGRGRFKNRPITFDNKIYDARYPVQLFMERSFWENKPERVKKFELAGVTEPYYKICKFREGPRQYDIISVKPRKYIADEGTKCTNGAAQNSTLTSLVIILLAICLYTGSA